VGLLLFIFIVCALCISVVIALVSNDNDRTIKVCPTHSRLWELSYINNTANFLTVYKINGRWQKSSETVEIGSDRYKELSDIQMPLYQKIIGSQNDDYYNVPSLKSVDGDVASFFITDGLSDNRAWLFGNSFGNLYGHYEIVSIGTSRFIELYKVAVGVSKCPQINGWERKMIDNNRGRETNIDDMKCLINLLTTQKMRQMHVNLHNNSNNVSLLFGFLFPYHQYLGDAVFSPNTCKYDANIHRPVLTSDLVKEKKMTENELIAVANQRAWKIFDNFTVDFEKFIDIIKDEIKEYYKSDDDNLLKEVCWRVLKEEFAKSAGCQFFEKYSYLGFDKTTPKENIMFQFITRVPKKEYGGNEYDELIFKKSFLAYAFIYMEFMFTNNCELWNYDFREKYETVSNDVDTMLSTYENDVFKNKIMGNTLNHNEITVDIDNMSGTEFERFVGDLFVKMGFRVDYTPASGDQGVDMVAEKETKIAIQAKCYAQPVGNSAIQEVVAGKTHYGCDLAYVITNNTFTAAAKKLASSNNVVLWDGEKLREMMGLFNLSKTNTERNTNHSIPHNKPDTGNEAGELNKLLSAETGTAQNISSLTPKLTEDEINRLTIVLQKHTEEMTRLYKYLISETKFKDLVSDFLKNNASLIEGLLFNQRLINLLETFIFCKVEEDGGDLTHMKMLPLFGAEDNYEEILSQATSDEALKDQLIPCLKKFELLSDIIYDYLHADFKLGINAFRAATWIAVIQLATYKYSEEFQEAYPSVTDEIKSEMPSLEDAIQLFLEKANGVTLDNKLKLGLYYFLLHNEIFGTGDTNVLKTRRLFNEKLEILVKATGNVISSNEFNAKALDLFRIDN